MSELLQLAAKLNSVTVPVQGFEKSFVLFQIVSFNEEKGKTVTALIIRPENKIEDSGSILIVGYSQNDKKVIPLNSKQIIFVLEQLQKYPEEDLIKCKLNFEEINEAKSYLGKFNLFDYNEILILELTKNIGALYSKNAENEYIWNFELEFNGGLSIKPISFDFIGTQGSNDIIDFTFNTEHIGFDNLKFIHLLDDIKIYIDATGKGKNHEYTGVCTKVNLDSNKIKMVINPAGFYFMNKSRMKAFLSEKANPLNLFYFISRNSGLPKDNINIQGFDWEAKYVYTVIIPVINLKLSNDSIGIGNVTFYPFEFKNTETEKFTNILEEQNERIEGFCWAQIYVESNNPYDAYVEGKQQILRALDTMMHVVRSDSVLLNYSTEYTLASWDKDQLIPKPSVTTWVSIHNAITGELIITDIERLLMPTQLVIQDSLLQRIDNIEWYEKMLLDLSYKRNKNLEPLFNALKWVRKSWDSGDKDDEIIYAIIALEFVVAGEKTPLIIPQKYLQDVTKGALDSFTTAFKGEEEAKLEYTKKLSDKLSQSLTDAPLFAKLDNLINRLEIPIRKQDIKLLKKARQIRNDLVHGRESKMLTNEEVWKVNTTVNTIISHKLFSLRGES